MEREQEYTQYALNFENCYYRQSQAKQEESQKNYSDLQECNEEENKYGKKAKKNLQNDQISSLFNKKLNLQRFMETIGQYSYHPIRLDILQHCQKLSINISNSLSKETIIKLVKNRVDKMIKNKRIKKNWSEEDIKILVWVISKYCQYHGIVNIKDGMTQADWINIADLIPGVTGKSCMFKWLSLKKNNLAENSWVEEESLLLDEMVKKYGQDNWCVVSQQLFLKNPLPNKIYRCPKQCREHWNCYLNPQLKKGPWDKKQDYLLLRAVLELQGVKKWAEIVKMFNGRTQNALKNRFNLIVQKQMKENKGKKKLTELQIVQSYLRKNDNQFSVDQKKLKFLSQKREFLNQNQAKRKPKKVGTKKIKEQKMSSSQEQEYMPQQNSWRLFQRKPLRGKPYTRQQQQRLQIIQKQDLYYRQQSFNPVISVKKDQQIFEQDQEMLESMKWGELRQLSSKKNIQCQQQHTKQQNLSIQPQGVYFVPFSDEVIRRYRNQTLIPCKITETNQIVQLKMSK